ncbi:urate oxidase [Hymenobacter sp. RP-2-7]|uniref:Uricase n=1 Tax=Hymenobacter polaris TaxID=2682546 RepID=A0A7Y0FP76_9BACT|nr:urate oxidase [Hymenobacter polaris]NML67752.1 urate oxidase [Hymenobacter polaris]
MAIKLGKNHYGKQAVHLTRVIRHPGHHELRQVTVGVQLSGDYERAHTHGDNALVLPTDTQKNTVYALAKEHFTGAIESFALVLARHFVSRNPQVSQARIEVVEHPWQRLHFDGQAHPHAFVGGGSEKRRAVVELPAGGAPPRVWAGLQGLLVAKTADSGFVGYPKDEYTTLPETTDRILSTEVEAEWEYTSAELDFNALFDKIRLGMLHTFAGHPSQSVQHTLYAMGERVLEATPEVKEISLVMPNKHHIPFNLTPFGQENTNEVFVATDAPFGYITGTVVRE